MLPSNPHPNRNLSEAKGFFKPGVAFIAIIFCALVAFEIFNYSTTEHALHDLLGDNRFAGILWSTILALAFCGIDFAGIARLFTPEQGMDESKEVWYLFAAWLIAATMNAVLTWWGVSMAVVNHNLESGYMIDTKTIASIVPVFVAIMVWVIRILIIGTLSMAVDRLIHPDAQRSTTYQNGVPAVKSLTTIESKPGQTALKQVGGNYGIPTHSLPGMSRTAAPRNNDPDRAIGAPNYHSLSMSSQPRSGEVKGPRTRRP